MRRSKNIGRMGGHLLLILTTTGRRTGRPFSTPIIDIADGGVRLVVASNGGTQQRHARFLSDAERAEWWPRLVAAYKPYAAMQARTDRGIDPAAAAWIA